MFSLYRGIEISRQYVLPRTDVLQKTVIALTEYAFKLKLLS